MRALRVVGLGIDGRTVILETVEQRSGERRERFTLPADEGLRAAVRGDLPRLGQIEIEQESQMRPREIQARIRAGESVEQVAAAAGVPTQRIERFAYPVLLERSRTAQLAQQAHPVRSDGPDVRTLEEVVTETFTKRGHDYSAATWDSWRGENGKWIVQLRWPAGRSDNKAHWMFHPGAHGGTVTAIDDHATDLIDPQAAAQLRTVSPVIPLPGATPPAAPSWEPTPREQPPAPPQAPARATAQADPLIGVPAAAEEQHTAARAVPDDGPAYRPSRPGERPGDGRTDERRNQSAQDAPPAAAPPAASPAAAPPAAASAAASSPVAGSATGTPATETTATGAPAPGTPTTGAPPAAAPPAAKRGRKDRPKVPSWEDVLLGVRSPRE